MAVITCWATMRAVPTGNSALISTATRRTLQLGKVDVEYVGGCGCGGSGLRSLVQASASAAAATSSLVIKGRRTGPPGLELAASYHPCGVSRRRSRSVSSQRQPAADNAGRCVSHETTTVSLSPNPPGARGWPRRTASATAVRHPDLPAVSARRLLDRATPVPGLRWHFLATWSGLVARYRQTCHAPGQQRRPSAPSVSRIPTAGRG